MHHIGTPLCHWPNHTHGFLQLTLIINFVANIYHHSFAQTYQILCMSSMFVNPHLWYPWSCSTFCFFVLHCNLIQPLPHSCVQRNMPCSLLTPPQQLESYPWCKVQIQSCVHHTETGGWGWHQKFHIVNRLTILKTCWQLLRDIGVIFMTRTPRGCIHISAWPHRLLSIRHPKWQARRISWIIVLWVSLSYFSVRMLSSNMNSSTNTIRFLIRFVISLQSLIAIFVDTLLYISKYGALNNSIARWD